MTEQLLHGVIDMHVHTNPDIRLRAYDDLQMTEAGIRAGARAIVIKTHQGATMDRATLCNLYNRRVHGGDNGFEMFGSITLNRVVGGINPWAVDVALRLGAKVVWLPTASARNHLCKMGMDEREGVDVVRGGRVVPELETVFSLIRDQDAVLATGHIAPQEAFVTAEAARRAGVRKIVVTHPEWWVVGMSLEEQKRMAADYGAVMERCYAQNMGGGRYKSNLADNAEAIRELGYRNVLISTDGGQVENPRWEEALAQYIRYLLDHGIAQEQVRYMTRTLPARLLGI